MREEENSKTQKEIWRLQKLYKYRAAFNYRVG